MDRLKIVGGSFVGALALHVVMVACGSAGPSLADDAGVLANMRDAVVDALNGVVDAETRDAHAGGDGGVAVCTCPPAVETTFTVAGLSRDGTAETPLRDYSTAGLGVSPVALEDARNRAPTAAGPGYNLFVGLTFRTADATRVGVSCNTLTVRPDRTTLPGTECTFSITRAQPNSDGGVQMTTWTADTSSPETMGTIEVARLEETRVELRLAGLRFAARTSPGARPVVVAIDNLVVTSTRTTGSFLAPPQALR